MSGTVDIGGTYTAIKHRAKECIREFEQR